MHARVLPFVFLLTTAAFAQERPFDMNGIVLGSELAAVERTSRFACSESRSAVADQLCRLKPGEKEILEDLIVAAHADARRKVETLMKDKMQSVAGGLPLPPGMKLF